ncbi:MAG: acyl-CoA dehydrogenase family protein [Deltaproteobacteria bacterium]|nr:acyl-CoA dehydrogenase family protein [Deltaproteobacteria bacterium]MBW2385302.1 acyl-CoA dehydrogenase family protein [Deltaproteobacteria bacterium]MBW2695809.1 acyl-CoA dehydrogenase family protein [Deltaproteobacteria bacterium]
MLDLDPGDELGLVADTARKLADDHLGPAVRIAEAARQPAADVFAAYTEIGLAGLELPESAGGAGQGALARVLVNEELAAVDVGSALALDPLGLALYPVVEMGGESAAAELAVGCAELGARAVGVLVGADAQMDEGMDLQGDVASGSVPWLPADRVDSLVLLAGESMLWIDRGIDLAPVRGMGLRAAGASEASFRDAPLRERFVDAAGAARARARGRLYVASLLLGVMRAACDFSRDYAQERQAFGRPIAHHQALAFLITDMQMALDGARLLVHEAAWRIDRRLEASAAAASAYAQCIDAARSIGPNAVQILGGHGFVADYPVEKHMREARSLSLLWGGFDAAIDEAGRALCRHPSPLALGLETGERA